MPVRIPSLPVVLLAMACAAALTSEHRVRDSFVALAPGDGHDGLLTVGADVRATHPNPRYWAAFQLVGAG